MKIVLTPQIWMGLGALGFTLALGLVLSWLNVRGSQGPKERRYVTRACTGSLVLMLVVVGGGYFLESPYRYIVMLIGLFGIPVLIYRSAKVHLLIREMESRDRRNEDSPTVA